jgi:hypothetical protein
MLIFGSTALKHWCPDFSRSPKDLDYMSKSGTNSREIEYHWADGFDYVYKNNKDTKYVDLNFLYTIKVSHASWDIKWDKTMYDIIFMKSKGATLDKVLYDMLYANWEIIHRKKRINMKITSEQFFTKKITRIIPHDDIHMLVKWYDVPLYETIRKDKNTVACSSKAWYSLNEEDKKRCALEEAYVFALERYFVYPPITALQKALKTLITSSTKGYFNIFLIENFKELLYYERERYLSIFNKTKELIYG